MPNQNVQDSFTECNEKPKKNNRIAIRQVLAFNPKLSVFIL